MNKVMNACERVLSAKGFASTKGWDECNSPVYEGKALPACVVAEDGGLTCAKEPIVGTAEAEVDPEDEKLCTFPETNKIADTCSPFFAAKDVVSQCASEHRTTWFGMGGICLMSARRNPNPTTPSDHNLHPSPFTLHPSP